MAKGYWISRVDVHDPEAYKSYVSEAAPAFAQYGAKFLVRGGQIAAVEGQARIRNVVIEFPSFQAALDCYNSPVYQAAKAHRVTGSIGEVVIAEGFEA